MHREATFLRRVRKRQSLVWMSLLLVALLYGFRCTPGIKVPTRASQSTESQKITTPPESFTRKVRPSPEDALSVGQFLDPKKMSHKWEVCKL